MLARQHNSKIKFATEVSDLHMHLSGSVSMSCLKEIAKKNNCLVFYQDLKKVKADYKVNTRIFPEATLIALIWKQFQLIHNIIQTVDDIKFATKDVVRNSKAAYLEIRTCPKEMGEEDWCTYVDMFVAGLEEGNEENPDRLAKGLLSLDRTLHNKAMAFEVMDRIVCEKNRNGLIVGLDISGNPLGKRTLTGSDLQEVLLHALNRDIGLGIHIGEVDNQIERTELDNILQVLFAWFDKNGRNPDIFKGKVRLGHSIYLTAEQRSLIQTMHLPIEICPTGHQMINWWKENEKHPITLVYPFWASEEPPPVVVGTDDGLVFECNAHHEDQKLKTIIGFPEEEDSEIFHLHQSQYRF